MQGIKKSVSLQPISGKLTETKQFFDLFWDGRKAPERNEEKFFDKFERENEVRKIRKRKSVE